MSVPLFWAVVFGFLTGVFLRSFTAIGWWTCLFMAFLGFGVAGLIWTADRVRIRATSLVVVFILAVALGVVRMHMAILEHDPVLDQKIGEEVVLEGVVRDEPDRRENTVRIAVHTESGAGVLVIAPLHTEVRYGDHVRAEGRLLLPESFEASAGQEFNYPAFLAKDGILYELSFADVKVIGAVRRNPLKVAAIWIKEKFLEGIALSLPEPEAGLAGGITAGDKRGLGADLSETFRVVGLIHIVVLSGYNIMVVIGAIERLFGWTKVWVRSVLGAFIAIMFALMTGLAASSVRAASMATIATIGKATGRTYLASRALALVAFGMVLSNPYILAFDPGFQLSIIATIGLITISPLFAERLTFITERFGLREIASATLGTQMAVLPLILYQNGEFSLYALPANLLALTVVPYAMLLSFIAGVLGLFAGPIAPLIGFPAYILLWWVVTVGEFFAWLPLSSVAVPAFSATFLFVAYAALVGFILFAKKNGGPRGAPPRQQRSREHHGIA